ncbi:hypothetical protein [Bradyrhizobium stylosanthis]|uniref:hypothetical protein n=1 Tax=Bradyrhizobium stylosanthis TaxID=1803665 RepID=UPI0016447189|nr:hypothetical protein [Bradyrhizobium stylosanthis]
MKSSNKVLIEMSESGGRWIARPDDQQQRKNREKIAIFEMILLIQRLAQRPRESIGMD